MPQVRFTPHLRRFFPDLRKDDKVPGTTVADVIQALEARHPGFASYIVDERGRLRQHVNIFIGDSLIRDREQLRDPVADDQLIYIMQALSGGSAPLSHHSRNTHAYLSFT